MKKKQVNNEEIEFYTKEYVADQNDTDSCVEMVPNIVSVPKPNPNACTSFILGIVGSVAWIVPLIGLPVTIVGTVLGAIGMKNKRNKGFAIAGFITNLVF
ncbi:MAG: hypothetical protein RR582_11370, partial [Niameybacter sp.]